MARKVRFSIYCQGDNLYGSGLFFQSFDSFWLIYFVERTISYTFTEFNIVKYVHFVRESKQGTTLIHAMFSSSKLRKCM